MKKNKVTLKDVAERANVSLATVSRVINNTGLVKPNTYQDVMASVNALGYEIKKSDTQHRKNILIVSSYKNNTLFYDKTFSAIQTTAASQGFGCMSYICNNIDNDCENIVDFIAYFHVAGIITFNYIHKQSTFLSLKRIVPVVQCITYNESLDCSFFSWDHYGESKKAVSYLLSLGKQRIAFLNGSEYSQLVEKYQRGYEDAFKSAGLAPNPNDTILLPHGTIEEQYSVAYTAAQQLLMRTERPDAFFCTDEVFATAAVAAAGKLGIKVPDDLSVMGFGNTFISIFQSPKLTTVSTDASETGFAAVEHIIECTKHPDTPVRKVFLNAEIILRETVGHGILYGCYPFACQ